MLWLKAAHILFVMSWMAGIFYLPRIFVHFVEGKEAGQDVTRLAIMAKKLYGFMTIMMMIAIGTGIWLWLGLWFCRWLAACEIIICRFNAGLSFLVQIQDERDAGWASGS